MFVTVYLCKIHCCNHKKNMLNFSISINVDRHLFPPKKNERGQTQRERVKRCHRCSNFKALNITITKRLL